MTTNLSPFSEFAGLPVVEVNAFGITGKDKPASEVAWRVTAVDFQRFSDAFSTFLAEVEPSTVTALLLGDWGYDNSSHPVEQLLAVADRFVNVRSLFIGDFLIRDERSLSGIEHTDITEVFAAFPLLERLGVRGGHGRGSAALRLRPFRAEQLRELRFESNALPGEVVRAVGASDLPRLEHLELWYGPSIYSYDDGHADVTDLSAILLGKRLPTLQHLGVQNADVQDEIAIAVSQAPIVAGLQSLALSLGTLSDTGAEALLNGQSLTHLQNLDLHHHYLSEDMMERLHIVLPNVNIDVSDRQTSSGFRRTGVWDGD